MMFLSSFFLNTPPSLPLSLPHRADGGLLVAELLLVPRHHVFDLQLLHDLLFLQVRVLLLGDGASQLLRVRLGQTHFQLGREGIPAEGEGRAQGNMRIASVG